MLRTVEATIDEIGVLRMLEPVKLPKLRRAIVMILDEEPAEDTLNRENRNQEIALWKSNMRRDMRGFLQIGMKPVNGNLISPGFDALE